MKRSQGTPILVTNGGSLNRLERVTLGAGHHDEAWLQALIHERPDLIPMADIEPAFAEIVSVAREVPCGHGTIDNLYVTPAGDIVLVETKLWRNVQARREVVAQALDYVSALMKLGYDGLETAIKRSMGYPKGSLYSRVADAPGALDEQEFIDAVATNLRRGRMLVLALGDGIRREAETLASLLQSHAGAHFTFALVELSTWRNTSTGEMLVVPNTLAQTVMIERGIVVVQDGRIDIDAMTSRPAAKAQTLSEESFLTNLGRQDAVLPDAIRSFGAKLEPLGVYFDQRATLNLKVDIADAPRPLNLGFIDKQGHLHTKATAWSVPPELAVDYNQTLAALIHGRVAEASLHLLSSAGRPPHISELLPEHADAWAAAIQRLVEGAQVAQAA